MSWSYRDFEQVEDKIKFIESCNEEKLSRLLIDGLEEATSSQDPKLLTLILQHGNFSVKSDWWLNVIKGASLHYGWSDVFERIIALQVADELG